MILVAPPQATSCRLFHLRGVRLLRPPIGWLPLQRAWLPVLYGSAGSSLARALRHILADLIWRGDLKLEKKLNAMKIRLGPLAFLAGFLAAIMAILALFPKKVKTRDASASSYEDWGDSLGI